MPALGGEVALGADRLAADHAHQAGPAAARRQARSVGAERRHHQAQRKLVTHRRELGVQARVARHLPGGLRRVGVHLEAGGERAQGLLDFFLGAGGVRRNGKATGNEVGRLLLLGREAHQPQALRAVLNERDQTQCFGFTALVGVADVVDVVVNGRAAAAGSMRITKWSPCRISSSSGALSVRSTNCSDAFARTMHGCPTRATIAVDRSR
jgi:hypothetical protein